MSTIVLFSGILAVITSFIGLLPQIVKSLKTKSTQDISLVMLINYLICSLAWIIYGMGSASFFVLAANVVGLLGSLTLIFIKKQYD